MFGVGADLRADEANDADATMEHITVTQRMIYSLDFAVTHGGLLAH